MSGMSGMSGMSSTAPARARRREWIGLAVLALPCSLVTMDLTVLLLAVPSLSGALEPSASELLWITEAYGLLMAGALVVMGAWATGWVVGV